MIRRRITFSGRVQNVGFRATAASLASNFQITGYVRNLPDSTVELEAQGPPSEVESFLTTLRQRMHSNILGEDAISLPVREDESIFEIRR
jgi:acylphosphatase